MGEQLDVFIDRSLDEPINSNDTTYVNRKIREDYISGSSLTIVLCGADTWKRKYVDWEIYSTLHLQHALLGIALPTAQKTIENNVFVPDRLYKNIQTGYAHWISWDPNWTMYPSSLGAAINEAVAKSRNKNLIDNSEPKMSYNKP